MGSNVGYRIFERPPVPNAAILDEISQADIAHLADAMNKFGVIDSEIQPMYRPIRRIVGPALTVKVHPGDHLMVRKAMSLAATGDVLVIDSRADTTKAVWGGMVSEMMVRRQLAGVIIDGAARDAEHIKRLDLPVWVRGITATGPTFTGPGEINSPVCCGGVVVMAGDVVVADSEGIVVIPSADVATVVEKLVTVVSKEQGWMEQIEAGELLALAEVDEALNAAGVTHHDTWKASFDER